MAKVDNARMNRVEKLFSPLNRIAARNGHPAPGSFVSAAEVLLSAGGTSPVTLQLNDQLIILLARASVEIWHRGLHSFLISAATTKSSPIWSSVCLLYTSPSPRD